MQRSDNDRLNKQDDPQEDNQLALTIPNPDPDTNSIDPTLHLVMIAKSGKVKICKSTENLDTTRFLSSIPKNNPEEGDIFYLTQGLIDSWNYTVQHSISKNYYEKNKEKITQWQQVNKEEIAERRKLRIKLKKQKMKEQSKSQQDNSLTLITDQNEIEKINQQLQKQQEDQKQRESEEKQNAKKYKSYTMVTDQNEIEKLNQQLQKQQQDQKQRDSDEKQNAKKHKSYKRVTDQNEIDRLDQQSYDNWQNNQINYSRTIVTDPNEIEKQKLDQQLIDKWENDQKNNRRKVVTDISDPNEFERINKVIALQLQQPPLTYNSAMNPSFSSVIPIGNNSIFRPTSAQVSHPNDLTNQENETSTKKRNRNDNRG